MADHFIDLLVIIVFSTIARLLWIYSKTKKKPQIKLLFRAISLFIFLHLILFPVVYSVIINKNTQSIRIDENIFLYEKERKLLDAKRIEKEINSNPNNKKERKIINKLLDKNNEKLKNIAWNEVDKKQMVFLDSKILTCETVYRMRPGDRVMKAISIYDDSGQKLIKLNSLSEKNNLSSIFLDYLTELDSKKNEIAAEIKNIESNTFWTYRQILPYTINILFTDNFNPKSKSANIIYFIHNILVVGFLLAFIVSFFQYYLINNTKIED